jgi:hypothetical protein
MNVVHALSSLPAVKDNSGSGYVKCASNPQISAHCLHFALPICLTQCCCCHPALLQQILHPVHDAGLQSSLGTGELMWQSEALGALITRLSLQNQGR